MSLKTSKAFQFLTSIRFRLTALFVCIFGSTLVLFSVLLYQVLARNHMREFDAALYNYAVDVGNGIQVNFLGDLRFRPAIPFDEKKTFPFAVGQSFFQITGVNGVVLARSTNLGDMILPIRRTDVAKLLGEEVVFEMVDPSELPPSGDPEARRYRLIKYLVKLPSNASTILMVAVPMTLFERERKGILAFLWVFVPIILALATLGGWFFSGSALRPIKLINRKARRINPSNLAERLPVPVGDDEVRALSLTLNDLLGRIQRAFDSQEKFIADVSHEMKTPLAILRGELDLVKQKSHSLEVKEYLESADQEIAHLSELVQNLLVLARVDAGVSCLAQGSVRVDEVVLDTVALTEPFARSSGKRVSVNLIEDRAEGGVAGAHFQVKGDAGLLQCLAKNLVENAIKFSDKADNVEVEVVDGADAVILSVRDRGVGIPIAERKRIFERFYRGEATRNRVRGSGLGLHLADRIADIHGGRISVASEIGQGTVFRVELPKSLIGN